VDERASTHVLQIAVRELGNDVGCLRFLVVPLQMPSDKRFRATLLDEALFSAPRELVVGPCIAVARARIGGW
jgi:hypothetical protein